MVSSVKPESQGLLLEFGLLELKELVSDAVGDCLVLERVERFDDSLLFDFSFQQFGALL